MSKDKPVKILLVDDEKWTLSGASMRFPKNYKIVWARDCETAFMKLRKEQFDIILMDVMMPGLSGIDCIEQLREKNNRIPVMFLTGVNRTDACAAAFRLGAVDYITKPIDFRYLLDRIAEVLKKRVKKDKDAAE